MMKTFLLLVASFVAVSMNAEGPLSMGGIKAPLGSFSDRGSYAELARRTLDGFGVYRQAGHLHAGLDIKASYEEEVVSIGTGTVKPV